MSMVQKLVFERIACRRIFVSQCPGQKANHRFHHDHCCKLTARQDIIADGNFFVDFPMDDPFIHAFVSAAHQNQAGFERKRSGQFLRQQLTLRAQQNASAPFLLMFGPADGGSQRFRLHDHTAAPAVGPVVRRCMPVCGKVPNVDCGCLQNAAFNRPTQNAVFPESFEEVREYGNSHEMHG